MYSSITQDTHTIDTYVTNDDMIYNGIRIDYTGVYISGHNTNDQIIIDSNGTSIHELITPTANTDAANKKYVDDNKGAQVQIVRW